MAESAAAEAAPTISQGQTTSVAEGAQAMQLEGEAVPAAQPEQNFFSNPLLWIVAAMWLWFLFGNKKRKAARAQEKQDRLRRESLEKGDKIVTIGRMHGTVVAYTDDTVTIKPDHKSDYTMTFDKQAIYRVMPRPGEEDAAAEAGKK